MAFSIRLYKMTCEKNRVDKTNYLTNRTEYNGTFKSATSLSTPSFILETPNGISDIQGFNYFYIFQLHRYYFITDLISISDKLTQINGRVDVLMSLRNKFMNLNAMISRNENTFDVSIEDELYPFESRREVTEYEPTATPQATSLVNTEFSTDYKNWSYVAQVVGWSEPLLSDEKTTAQRFKSGDIVAPTGTNLPTIDADNWSIPYSSAPYVFISEIALGFFALACNQQDRTSLVKNAVVYPFQVRRNNPTESRELIVSIGDGYSFYTLGSSQAKNGVYAYYAYSLWSDYLVIADFVLDNIFGWEDYNPTTEYQIYLPFYGYTDLDVATLINHRLIVYYMVNYENNQSQVYIYDMTTQRIIFTDSCKLGVEISLTSSNMRQIKASDEALGLNFIFNQFANYYKMGKGAIEAYSSGDTKNLESGVSGFISNQIDLHNKSKLLYVKGSATFGGQVAPLFSPMKVRIRKSSPRATITDEEWSDYKHLFGLPLQTIRTLSELSGFTIVSDIHLENLDNALDGEINELYSLLTSGVIL